MNGKELVEQIENGVSFTDWENEIFTSNRQRRWVTIFHFYSVGCQKAGYIIKNKGTWILTKEGEEVASKGAEYFLDSAGVAYRKWAAQNKKEDPLTKSSESTEQPSQIANIELLEAEAADGIINYINQKNPYEFQELVAALLRAMGYFTDFIAERGKDGGIDIIAYQDVLGIQRPRIKVQVKHYPKNPISVDTVRSLKGLLNSGEEVGLFVTSGSFTSESKKFAREANVHIKLIDGNELIELWQENYNKLSDDDKYNLPLKAIYFLGSQE